MTEDKFLENSLNKTNFDLDSKEPSGGPINDSDSGFEHKYTPTNTYLDSIPLDQTVSPLKNDLENDGASTDLDLNPDDENGFGGPNRTNAANIPSGQYINVTAGGKGYVGGKPGSEINTVTLHQYTPDRTYLNTINDPDNFPEPSVQLPNNDITSNIPTDIDSGIAGDVEGGTPDVSRYTFPA